MSKGDDTPDRPHRMARILEAPERLEPVPRELLEELVAMLPEAPQAAAGQAYTNERGNGGSFYHAPIATAKPGRSGSRYIPSSPRGSQDCWGPSPPELRPRL